MSTSENGKESPRNQAIDDLARRMSKVFDQLAPWEDKLEWKQVTDAMLSLKGQNLSDLPPRLKRHIESTMMKINEVLSKYSIETWEDYRLLTQDDLFEVRDLIEGIAFRYR
jgi:hypothetical protein